MFEKVFCIKYLSVRDCFIHVSPKNSNFYTGTCIKVSYNSKDLYFTTTLTNDVVDVTEIGINRNYAKYLDLNEDEHVNVAIIELLPVASSITVAPYDEQDFELISVFANDVQENLLNTIRALSSGQSLNLFVGDFMQVRVIIDKVEPVSPAMLDFLTEVVIRPTKAEQRVMNIPSQIQNITKSITHCEQCIKQEEFYRLIPKSYLPFKILNSHPLDAFVFTHNAPHTTTIYTLTLTNLSERKLWIKVHYLPNEGFYACDNLFVDDTLRAVLNHYYGQRGVLKPITERPSVKTIRVHGMSKDFNVVEECKKYLGDRATHNIVLCSKFPVQLQEKLFCDFSFEPPSQFCVITAELLRTVSFEVVEELVQWSSNVHHVVKEDLNVMDITVSPNSAQRLSQDICLDTSNVINDILRTLFKQGHFIAENIIITGSPGTGKSSLINHLAELLPNHPYYTSVEVLRCKKLKRKTLDSLFRSFTSMLSMFLSSQPAVLVLDDLHVLCEKGEGEDSPVSTYFNRVSEMLSGLISAVQSAGLSIAVVATATSLSKLNEHIYKSRGAHIFKNVFHINPLTNADRLMLLNHFFSKQSSNIDLEDLIIKTDGFVVQDLKDLYEKILFEAYKDCDDDPVRITQTHCAEAFKKSCALALQNVKFHSVGTKTFADVGGLHNVKGTLVESLLWPVKYPKVFAHAPLRLQSGILLYGPPGSGKTLLAAAAAKQCNLRLISIKGPELLSKYVGASEEAVRDIFDKAQKARPCILFFDEFDSLAHRRGQDISGVTDRVVNQLLTQLDGIEALEGVCVLAATSRPELLDPALLRPGRLDKQLYCPLPDKEERHEILQVLARKLDLDVDVKLEDIAVRTEGFSGADLQSLLFTARVSTVKDIECIQINGKITQEVLLEALGKTKPSLSKKERANYEKIYSQFRSGDMEDFKAGVKVQASGNNFIHRGENKKSCKAH